MRAPVMIPIASPEQTRTHVAAFTQQGYTHFHGAYTATQVENFRVLYDRAAADWRFANGTPDNPDAVGGLLERFPREVFPAVTHPDLLGLAEAVMGPFAQLDSVVVNSDPPVNPAEHGRPVMWHRDRFGSLPQGQYTRPASIVYLGYLQPMTDAAGPLRVVPGSHRQPRTLSDSERYAPLQDEVLVQAQPGDVIAIHHNLLHSGTRNTSDSDRRFLGFILNLSALRAEDNFSGPNCRAFIEAAHRANDRRLLRLLGEDPLIFPRQNSGFTASPEDNWQRWTEDDSAFAREGAEAAETARRVRSTLIPYA